MNDKLSSDLEAEVQVFDDEGHIDAKLIEATAQAIEGEDKQQIEDLLSELHESDLAEVIETIEPEQRIKLIDLMGEDFDFAVLTELDTATRVDVLSQLPQNTVVRGISELDSDDAVYLLEDLEEEEQTGILSKMSALDRINIKRSLDYPEETAGRIMQVDFVAIPPFWTVGQCIDHLRESKDLPDEFYEILVVDHTYKYVGYVPLGNMLRRPRATKISEITIKSEHTVNVIDDQEDVALLFQRYNMISAAVVDDSERLMGVITIDDIVDIIQQEAHEDMNRLAGIGDEEISDSVVSIVKSRALWLTVNLITAILASAVIGVFQDQMQRMVALAVLMPIIASMGGNAGTQTMTVIVRALATREFIGDRARRAFTREAIVALLNGVFIGLICVAVTLIWFQDVKLAMVVGIAIVINLLSAGLAGTLIPILMEKVGADPAIASGVFVTTVTDVVGFAAFLGIATLFLGLV